MLFILSAAPLQTLADGKTRPTGYFLNEFYEPFRALINAGYDVRIATPHGRAPAMDPESLKPKYWKQKPHELGHAKTLVTTHPQMKNPLPLSKVMHELADFQGVVIPGGQGVMVDLLDDENVHAILRVFGSDDRPVGLVCHAPALLFRMKRVDNPFAGRAVTSVSGLEEWYIETFVMGARAKVRGIGKSLEAAGHDHHAVFPGRAGAVRDCNLVTSQNPFSSERFNQLFLQGLRDWRRGGRCIPIK